VQTSKETLGPTRVRLIVEVPFDEFKPRVDAAYKRVARQVRVPGFRPGKAPARILDQRVGRGHILEEALHEALPDFYSQAVEQAELVVLSRPEVDITKLEDGDQLVFTAEMDVRPEITLPDYEGMEISVDEATVSDEDVAEQLDGLRDRFAVLVPVERPAEDGDFLSIDFDATVDDEEVPGAKTSGYSYELGSAGAMSGLDAALAGATEGETRTFETELVAGDFAGQTAQVTVTVGSVKRKELPDLDDEFATTASEFDTLEELRADIRERLLRTRRLQQGFQARDRVLEELVNRTEVPLPDSVLDEEVQARKTTVQRQLDQTGLTLEAYLAAEDKTAEQFETETREAVARQLKAQFVLDAVVSKEQPGVEEHELTDHLVRLAERAGMAPDEYAQQVIEGGRLPAVMAEILRGKALAGVMQAVRVVDSAGNPVDLEEAGRPLTGQGAGAEAVEPEGDAAAEAGGGEAEAADAVVGEAAGSGGAEAAAGAEGSSGAEGSGGAEAAAGAEDAAGAESADAGGAGDAPAPAPTGGAAQQAGAEAEPAGR
jgi:trigger factor